MIVTTLSLPSAMVFRYRVSGWLLSLVTHAIIAGAAALLMSDLRLAKQPEPFRWQVAVTQPSVPQNAEVPPPPRPSPTPTPKVAQPPKPVQKPPTPTQQRLEQIRPVNQTIQAVTPVTRQEIRKVEQVVQSERPPSEVVQSQPTFTREVESPNQTAETRLLATNSAPTVTESVVTQSRQVVAEESSVVAHEVMDRADSHVTEETAISEKTVTSMPAQVNESAQVPIESAAVHTRPVAESSVSRAAVESAPVEIPMVQTMPVIEPSAIQPTPTAPMQQASIQNVPAQSMPATKADYSWLLDALWNRVEQLKRYPHIARTNRWEGLVVLKAVISQDGQLLDLKVAESSGHSVLDQDAMDVMRRSCPLQLKHPLGKPQVELRIPISYKLR
jgi:periplasmic protein TonB